MAYMDQEKKAKIAVELKKVMPKNWKYTLKVSDHAQLQLVIRKADVDILDNIKMSDEYKNRGRKSAKEEGYFNVNHYYIQDTFKDKKLADVFSDIYAAMNCLNYNNSNIMADYFDVGYYIAIKIGEWDKPFQFESPKKTEEQPFLPEDHSNDSHKQDSSSGPI